MPGMRFAFLPRSVAAQVGRLPISLRLFHDLGSLAPFTHVPRKCPRAKGPMKKADRVGVVGVGHIGKESCPSLRRTAVRASFTAIYDTDPRKARDVSEEFHVPASISLDEFSENVEAASIATPTNTHVEL